MGGLLLSNEQRDTDMNWEALPVHRFLLKVILWLPLCFLVWYLLAAYWLAPVVTIMDWGFASFLPNAISDIRQNGYVIEVMTRFKPSNLEARVSGAVLSVDINLLIYAYSLPLYAGLTLAAPVRSKGRKALYLLAGLIGLIPFILWGATFDLLKTLAFNMSADTASYLDFSGGRREFIGWGYQFGYLILPGVMPLAIWIALHREFLQQLAPGLLSRTDEAKTAE